MKHYEGKGRQFGLCAAVLAIALLLRFATSESAQAAVRETAGNPAVAAAIMRVSLGGSTAVAAQEPEPEPAPESETPEDESASETQAEPAAEETAPEPLVFTQADADTLVVGGTSSYSPDLLSLLTQELKLSFSQAGPQVLIIHTHATEAYAAEPGWEYEASDTLRTEDTDYNIVRVGTELASQLEALGIRTIHDTGIRDYPTYNGSYTRTLSVIEDYLAEYPSIRIVIDLHRDAAENADGSAVAVTSTIDGCSAAQLMFVVGTDEGGLQHPNWQENLALAARLQALLNREYSGLCRQIDLRTERFNQHATFGSLLVEVGASGNTLAQALRSMQPLAEAIAAVIGSCAAE